VPGGAGYLVKTVPKGSPAWTAGVLGGDRTATINGQEIVVRGDVILEIAGIKLKTAEDRPEVRQTLGAMKTGQPFNVIVLRAGKIVELSGKLP